MDTAITKRRVIAYVDGFNFYYRRLKKSPYKWLDLVALFDGLFPEDTVIEVKYFTARLSGKFNPMKPVHQDVYLRALSTLHRLTLIEGQYVTTAVQRPLAEPLFNAAGEVVAFAKVWDSDEKGSDVNLGSHLLNDAWADAYDLAVIVTNDSDLELPMRMARAQGKTIALIHPHNNTSRKLTRAASFSWHLDDQALLRAQLPEQINAQNGRVLLKPKLWRIE